MTRFETTGHVALRVSLSGGEVRVEAAPAPGVEIELVPLRDNDVTHRAIADSRVEMTDRKEGHEVLVQVPKRSGLLPGRGPEVAVRIRCPQDSDLTLRAVSADLEATGSLGAVDARTASGDVSLEDVEALKAHTASGDVRVEAVGGALELSTASGDATVRRCAGQLGANLVSGDLSVGEALGGLAVKSVSGDVVVRAAGGGDLRVQAVSGDVQLGIVPGQQLYIDASSVSGTMSSELGLDDGAPAAEGQPLVDLNIRTVSGDVRIMRAI